jgi:hypothetical protein
MGHIYSCTVWFDRQGGIGRTIGPKQVEEFDTMLDLEDYRSLQEALRLAAFRHRGHEADLALYRLEVRAPGQQDVIANYRYSAWPGEDNGPDL